MTFAIHSETIPEVAPGSGPEPTRFVLEDGAGGRAEVWPWLGFNCYRWSVRDGARTLELLYADPDLFHNGRPTRSGIPILFPFPNRIRDGRFTWEGKEYALPINGPGGKNAIHGFACRRPWRVVDQGADGTSAWITGAFRGSLDAPDCRSLWPADYEIRVTYRLSRRALRVEANVHNPDRVPLPFGLGYHPYYRLPFAVGVAAEECTVEVPARSFWELSDSLPTGERKPVGAVRDLNRPRPLSELHLDDVLTDLPETAKDAAGLRQRATIHGAPGAALRLLCDDSFRDMVVFTPPHRQAFCVEPYTCTTDAVNLEARGEQAGWRVLQPGQSWSGVVELRV
jgi:aldose 1-epimerase